MNISINTKKRQKSLPLCMCIQKWFLTETYLSARRHSMIASTLRVLMTSNFLLLFIHSNSLSLSHFCSGFISSHRRRIFTYSAPIRYRTSRPFNNINSLPSNSVYYGNYYYISSFHNSRSSKNTLLYTTESKMTPTNTINDYSMTINEQKMTKDITQIYTKAIEAVDPSCAIQSHLQPSSIIIEQQHSSSPNKTVNPLDYDGKIGMLNFIDPITSQPIHSYYEHHYDKIYIFAFGKASSAMATSAAGIISKAMPTIPIEGIVICKDDHGTNHEIQTLQSKFNIKVYYASHPIPDQRSVNASKAILNMIHQNSNNYESKKRTLIINCISGGGSSLFCSPREPLSIQDLAQTNNILLKSGMSINDMNIIRKRLENGKGGYLAAASYPCTSLTLVLSDVINDPLDIIASGPTVADDGSSWKEAWDLVLKFGLDGNNEMGGDDGCDFKLPDSVLSVLRDGLNGKLEDTPKSSHPVFRTNIIDHFLDDDWDEDHDDEKKSFAYCPTFDEQYSKTRTRYTKLSETMLVGNNYRAVLAAAQEAKHQGYNPIILGTSFEGEARYVAEMYINMASHLQRQRNFTSDLNESEDSLRNSFYMEKLPTALIAGGETTVTLKNHIAGKGGRNQELGLTAALKLRDKGLRDIVLASVGTDGTDGPTDAAGVIVDGGTVYRIEKSNGNEISGDLALENHDSYNFFSNVGQNEKSPLVKTGPTGTNVADICITLVM